MLVRIANDRCHAGKGSDFFGCALRIAAGDHDLGCGIFAMHTSHRGAGVLVSGGGYSAGVEYYDFGLIRCVGLLQASFPKLAFDGCAVRLCRPAAEICYIEGCHGSILT